MSKFEFMTYKPTPNDPYSKGFALVKVNVPTIVAFKRVTGKNGGEFFPDPNVQYISDSSGTKVNQKIVVTSDRGDEEILKVVIEEGYNAWKAQHSAHKPTSMSEVDQDDNLPF